MAPVMAIPPELRLKIFSYALSEGQASPACPTQLQSGKRCIITVPGGSGYFGEIGVQFLKNKHPRTTIRGLVLVCKQWHMEITSWVRQESKKPLEYRLDVMYLKDGSLWPTWTSIPRFATSVDVVYATFRIFDCPASLKDDHWWGPFSGGCGGPPSIYWRFMHMLKVFLLMGPWPLQRPDGGAKKACDNCNEDADASAKQSTSCCCPGMIIRKLVVDVRPAAEMHILPLEPEPRCKEQVIAHRFDFFKECGQYFRREHSTISVVEDDGISAGKQLAGFIEHALLRLVEMSDSATLKYGRLIYEQVGEIELRFDSHVTKVVHLSSFPETAGTNFSGCKQFYDEATPTKIRRENNGLGVVPLTRWTTCPCFVGVGGRGMG